MDKIEWQGYEWLTHERWGQIHPTSPHQWHDPSCVEVDRGELFLKTHYNMKTFVIDDKPVTSKVGVGLVSCTTEFGYGKFEIEAKLPKGPYLWPAFWMWSFDSWPPEIDVFEGYTNRSGSYFNLSAGALVGKFWRCASNVHLGMTPHNYNLGAKNHWLGFRSPSKKFNVYGVDWQWDSIKILFNNRVVREITDNNVLQQFRGKKMNVIINNGIQKEQSEDMHLMLKRSMMHVRRFNYYPH